jgi:hypothetical protein
MTYQDGSTPMRLIALTGPARSGKDTVARILADDLDYAPIGIAAPLKEAYAAIFGELPPDGPEKEKHLPGLDVSPRHILQTLGTEWGRNCVHKDLWILLAQGRVNYHLQRQRPVVITDCRFPNEAAWVRSAGGLIWGVRRHNTPEIRPHESENGIGTEPDYWLTNDGSLDHLRQAVHIVHRATLNRHRSQHHG